MHSGTMFNAYPDSIGNNLTDTVSFLSAPEMKDAFRFFYILPSVFNSDLDRGFSIISYELNNSLASRDDLRQLKEQGIDLTFDFILNHLSVLSPQFQDILKNGDESPYRHFFIDWNEFWEGRGEMTEDGYIKPDPDQFNYANLRKNGLPVLMIRLPDGRDIPYWNTFYQKVIYPEVTVFDMMDFTDGQYRRAELLAETVNSGLKAGQKPAEIDLGGYEDIREKVTGYLESRRKYMGQMDVNHAEPAVWEWYESVIGQLAGYGASMIRLDAFSRLHKAPKRVNFVNEPETWEILNRLRAMAGNHGMEVLPEIHAAYSTGYYKKLSDLGCMTYDYFLPGLILDALDTGDPEYLRAWAEEIVRDRIKVVNMLGCHDGIPMRDIRGLLPEERTEALIERLAARSGHKKIVHGVRDEVYQMNTTYYTALGRDDEKMILARAIQMFMPGKPQVWYVDLLAGENDEAVLAADPGTDTREVNRHNYTLPEATENLKRPVVRKQLELLRMRNTHPAFAEDAEVTAGSPAPHCLKITWKNGEAEAVLTADLAKSTYEIQLT